MPRHITMDYPDDGTLKMFPVGSSIIDFTDGVVKLADGSKYDLPYQLSDCDQEHMSYLYLTTAEKITIETNEFGKRTVLGTTKIRGKIKYIYIIATSPTPISFLVSTDPYTSLDVSESDTEIELITSVGYNSNDNVEYIGRAAPSTPKSLPLWQIKKIIYDTNENISDVQYADGTQNFTKTWDDRTLYHYS